MKTMNGKAAIVVQDAASYQRLLDEKERLEAIAGIQRGIDDMRRSDTRPLEDVIACLDNSSSSVTSP